MRSKRGLIALLLVLTLGSIFITSCDTTASKDAGELIAVSENKLKESPYTVSVITTFTTEDEDMKDIVNSLGVADVTLRVNGEDFATEINTVVGDFYINKSYTVVDNILYHKTVAELGTESATVKEKALVGTEERAFILSDAGLAAKVNHKDFDTVTVEKSDVGYTVICTDIKNDSLADLTSILAAHFEGTGATVNVGNVNYRIELADGAYVKTTLKADYKVLLDGVEYELCMKMSSTYSYGSEIAVSAPTDAAEYKDTEYTNIIK